MEIFKLGDDILALLEMALGFWNNQINLVFLILSLIRRSSYWYGILSAGGTRGEKRIRQMQKWEGQFTILEK